MPAPLLWLGHQKYFLLSKFLTKALSSLLSVSLGGLFFHAHLLLAFFFWSFIFFGGTFLVASFLPIVLGLLVLLAVPRCSFFKELLSAVIATIFSCSSVGLPQVFSLSNSHASYLFSTWIMRSSAVNVALPSSHWLLRSLM